MNYRIITKDSFSVIGKFISVSDNKKNIQIPAFWEKCHNDGTIKMLHFIDGDKVMGIGCWGDESGNFDYMIGVESDLKTSSDLTIWNIPDSTWIIFEPVISTAEQVTKVWGYIINDFLPNSKYRHAETPDIEMNYKIKDCDAKYSCEIWIPVIKK